MMRGLHPNRTRGRKARREGGGNQDNPRDVQHIRSVPEYDEQFDSVSPSTMQPPSEPRDEHSIQSVPEHDEQRDREHEHNKQPDRVSLPHPLCQSARKMRMVW